MQLLGLSDETRRNIELGLSLATAAYFVGLASWLVLRQLVGDATWWLFLLNATAFYLFVPLPLAVVIAAWQRNIPLAAGSLAAIVVFAWFWGGLFWPHERPQPDGPVLTVMTYNLLAPNPDPEGVVEALTASDADVITLQELSPRMAAAIERDLSGAYPYQALSPQRDTTGLGIVSRLPFKLLGVDLRAFQWIGVPMIAQVDFNGSPFVLVNAHNTSGSALVADRERQARLLTDFVAKQTLPVILMGDFNALDTNESYGIVAAHMHDAWREVGSGLGNTFPGASKDVTPGSKRPRILGIDLPKWLIRIDYVFCSYDWQPISARIGPWDGHSDHRPVIAEVALRQAG
jgi:endonuclease/exonuclease/phosphatase (EEP) superfamily protein YafD